MSDVKRPEPMFPVDLEGAPKITLAGREWPVPPMNLKQAREIVPGLMKIMPIISRIGAATNSSDLSVAVGVMQSLDAATFDIISHIVFWSLKRAQPGLARAEFDDMPITTMELFMAFPVIIQQVGFVKTGAPQMGEDPPTAPSIGIS